MSAFLLLNAAAALPQSVEGLSPEPTGLEWMVLASIIVPAVMLAVIIYMGRKTV